jgi:hypothetical protein
MRSQHLEHRGFWTHEYSTMTETRGLHDRGHSRTSPRPTDALVLYLVDVITEAVEPNRRAVPLQVTTLPEVRVAAYSKSPPHDTHATSYSSPRLVLVTTFDNNGTALPPAIDFPRP